MDPRVDAAFLHNVLVALVLATILSGAATYAAFTSQGPIEDPFEVVVAH